MAFRGAALQEHLARYDTPPASNTLQGYWARGQRQASGGAPARYEELARRKDLHPRWRLDLWRRASERRLLGAAWREGIADLDRSLELARRNDTSGGLRARLHTWAEQALVLALAQERVGDADAILDIIEKYLKDRSHPELSQRIEPWRLRLAGADAPAPVDPDRVEQLRAVVRRGAAPAVVPATTEDRLALVTADLPLWPAWLDWGRALTSQAGIPADRQAAADAYGRALARAEAAGGTPSVCVEAAFARLADHPATVDVLLAAAFDADVHQLTGSASPPRPSPLPELVRRHRGSQADLHALLGVAVYVEDMRGQLAAATPLPGTGLTRDRKRLFLYPLPGPGLLRDALLAAGNDPALLLAIARNESLFESAIPLAGGGPWASCRSCPSTIPPTGSALPGVGELEQALPVSRRPRRRPAHGEPPPLRRQPLSASLAAYNAGPGAVARWQKQLGGTADRTTISSCRLDRLSRRPGNYVEKVLRSTARSTTGSSAPAADK